MGLTKRRWTKSLGYKAPTSHRNEWFRRMSPEQRVNLALDMSSTANALMLDSIRDKHPALSRAKVFELARKRMRARTSSQQHVEDIRAILANTKVNKRGILAQARREGTVEIFREILRSIESAGGARKR